MRCDDILLFSFLLPDLFTVVPWHNNMQTPFEVRCPLAYYFNFLPSFSPIFLLPRTFMTLIVKLKLSITLSQLINLFLFLSTMVIKLTASESTSSSPSIDTFLGSTVCYILFLSLLDSNDINYCPAQCQNHNEGPI